MAGYTALIIDDDQGDRKLLRRLLSNWPGGMIIHEAETADEANGLKCCTPDVVCLDYLLAGENGLDLLPQLRDRWPRAAHIVMTGRGDEMLAKTAIQRGASDYIAKRSLNQSALFRMVKSGIERATLQWKIENQRQELETFSDVLVHDFKAPIRAVAFLAEQITEDLEEGDEDAVRRSLKLLGKSAQQMSDLVNSLALHVRVDREQSLELTDLKDVVERATTALHQEIDQSGATVEISSGNERFTCVPPLIAQLVQNLVANSIKFAADLAPRVSIEAKWVDAETLGVAVRDNGMGVPVDYHQRMFEPFRRTPGADGRPGTGLGLATCKKIAERHGGRIWCESSPGKGTTIFFSLKSTRPT